MNRFWLGCTGGGRERRNRGLHQSGLLSDWSGDEEAFSSDSFFGVTDLRGGTLSLSLWEEAGTKGYVPVFSMYSPARISRVGEWAMEACL